MTPTLRAHLPDLMTFVDDCANKVTEATLTDWQTFASDCFAFYTPDRMNAIEAIAPGWQSMSSYRDGMTLIHVTSVLVALMRLPEYKAATNRLKALAEWIVLFHDIKKVPVKGGHDYVHGFKSAAVAGAALVNCGFGLSDGVTNSELATWVQLTDSATIFDAAHQEMIQDNSKLDAIVSGLRANHSADACAVVLGVLLHISIITDPGYPIPAPVNADWLRGHLSDDEHALLKMMYLSDIGGWMLFSSSEEKAQHRTHIETAFSNIW